MKLITTIKIQMSHLNTLVPPVYLLNTQKHHRILHAHVYIVQLLGFVLHLNSCCDLIPVEEVRGKVHSPHFVQKKKILKFS